MSGPPRRWTRSARRSRGLDVAAFRGDFPYDRVDLAHGGRDPLGRLARGVARRAHLEQLGAGHDDGQRIVDAVAEEFAQLLEQRQLSRLHLAIGAVAEHLALVVEARQDSVERALALR